LTAWSWDKECFSSRGLNLFHESESYSISSLPRKFPNTAISDSHKKEARWPQLFPGPRIVTLRWRKILRMMMSSPTFSIKQHQKQELNSQILHFSLHYSTPPSSSLQIKQKTNTYIIELKKQIPTPSESPSLNALLSISSVQYQVSTLVI
jgi:hypothetical protein